MALRDQPYIPLYVKDFTSDEKLRMCSPSAVGVYIFLMCILHREKEYGKLQLRQSFVYTKDDTNVIQNPIQKTQSKENLYLQFSENLAKQMPFKAESILLALLELDYYGVIRLEGDTLCQPRMVRDGEISETRRKSANKRWGENEETENGDEFVYTKPNTKPNTKVYTKDDANALQNTEYENAYENNIISSEEKGVKGKKKRAFAPPTLEEVMKYCEERGTGIDPISFFDFYEANGWVQGKQGKPLKDWKAAVRYWERNGVTTTNSRNDGRQQATGTGTAAKAATGGYSEVRGDTPAKKTRHSTI